MNPFRLRPAAFLLLLATAGRGQTPTSAPKTPETTRPGKTAGARPSPLAQRLCDVLQSLPDQRRSQCCGTKRPPAGLAGACTQELGASLARGAVALDAAAIDQCAAETSRQLEGCDWVTPLSPRPPESCRNLVRGQLKAGIACRSSLECQDGLFCGGVGPNTAGVCSKPAPARTRCETPADNLVSFTRSEDGGRHLACEGLCLKGQCVTFAAAGGACQSSAACAPGLHCIASRCQDRPLPGIGESCAGGTSCGAGAYCRAGQCAALKGAGEACTLPVECRAFECTHEPGASVGACGEPCGLSLPAPGKPSAPAQK